MFYIGPLLHFNYSIILPRIFPESALTSAYQIALKKLAFDQFVFAPLITGGFFMLINIIDGKGTFQESVQAGVQDLKTKFKETMFVNWKLWIPANFLNFLLIPNKYQVLWANYVSLIYNAFLSYIYNNDKQVTSEKQEETLKN